MKTDDHDDRPLKLIDEVEGEWRLPISRRAIMLGVVAVSWTTALVWGFIEYEHKNSGGGEDQVPTVKPGPATVRGPGTLAGPAAQPLWSAELGKAARQIAVGTGVVIVEDVDGHLRGFDAQSGAAKWQSSVKLYPTTSPMAVLGDTLLGLGAGGRLEAVGTLDGNPRWQLEFAGAGEGPMLMTATLGSQVLVTGETLDKGTGPTAATIWALDTETHRLLWKTGQVSNHSTAETLAVSESAGVVLSADLMKPGLIAYSTTDRTELWRKSPDDGNVIIYFPFNCVAASGNTFYWAEYQLHALDATSGKELWAVSAAQPDNQFRAVVVVPRAAPDGGDLLVAAVVGDKYGGALYAFAAKTGERVWRQESDKRFGSETALSTANGIVFAAEADNGSVYAVDAKSGETRWTFHDPTISGSLEWVTAVDGARLYVAYGKTLLAFEP